MPLKRATGNMYPWVTHMHTHLLGECPHACRYCYVKGQAHKPPPRYTGPLRLDQSALSIRYGTGKVIFIEHCNDLFADAVEREWIVRILEHCAAYPMNTYVFQTKNPMRYLDFQYDEFPPLCFLGATIETNREVEGLTKAPPPAERALAMEQVTGRFPQTWKFFVTVEPILQFDLQEFAGMIRAILPDFCNIGADSKRHGLAEPTIAEVDALSARLATVGIEIKEKHNMDRLRQREGRSA